ncbi:hypothetical protein HMPREF3038_01516 [Akkermansia sp. KLE1797]|nr:hypothetical protein HMPREF3038_01516 [Akkermansia sp. KLE1797]KXU54004.1 hypothetical protein HMPREF3039_01669 [Akkermansia sp. KLE1798]KZA05488.1 hypothetical protein HMPREF1326_00663 [Akkermansia sp. KLE1605]
MIINIIHNLFFVFPFLQYHPGLYALSFSAYLQQGKDIDIHYFLICNRWLVGAF